MANEISASASLSANKNSISVSNSFSRSADMAGSELILSVQSIGTTAEAVALGDVSTIGFLMIKNMDETNFVEIDSANTFDKFPQKLLAGDFILLKPQTTTIYAKANTSACSIVVQAVEL